MCMSECVCYLRIHSHMLSRQAENSSENRTTSVFLRSVLCLSSAASRRLIFITCLLRTMNSTAAPPSSSRLQFSMAPAVFISIYFLLVQSLHLVFPSPPHHITRSCLWKKCVCLVWSLGEVRTFSFISTSSCVGNGVCMVFVHIYCLYIWSQMLQVDTVVKVST